MRANKIYITNALRREAKPVCLIELKIVNRHFLLTADIAENPSACLLDTLSCRAGFIPQHLECRRGLEIETASLS